MELDKKKYKLKEVNQLLEENSAVYERKLAEQKGRIEELQLQNSQCLMQIDAYRKKEESINSAMIRAEENAKKVDKDIQAEYLMTINNLKLFYKRWREYFNNIKEKYPIYDVINESTELAKEVEFLKGNSKDSVASLSTSLSKNDGNQPFDPKSKIQDYIASTIDNGFNLEEVLNPGELELEDLCKELGLIDE